MTPLVSLLIPVHNAEPYLDAALDSARNQTYTNLEILCCDDASEDGSVQVLEKHAAQDSRIQVFRRSTNGGVVETRNQLLAEARGEFIAWLDADDLIEPAKIERQLALLAEDPECGAVGTGVRFVDLDARPIRTESYPDQPSRQRSDPHICCASVLVRREAIENSGYFRPMFRKGGEDGDWLLRIADRWSLRNMPEPLYSYRVRSGSVSRSNQGAIRRLGVVARVAARERRQTGTCPIDAREFLTGSQDEVLASPKIAPGEKVLALSLPDPEQNPLVTVAIPFYRAFPFIGECLESLARQTFQNFEVVIYDDGSQPKLDLAQVPEAQQLSKDRIRLLRGEQNRGPAHGRNQILDAARGRYVVFQDADDISEPARLWILIEELFANPGLIAVGSALHFVDLRGKLLRPEYYPRQAITAGGFNGCCASFMYDKSRAPEVRLDEGLVAASEDVEFLLRLEEFGAVWNSKEVLYRYRVNPSSLTAQGDWLEAHTNFMWRVFAKKRGVFEESGLAPSHLLDLIFAADGTQTAELLLTLSYRQWRSRQISARRFVALSRLFPRSALHILYQHFLLAVSSRSKALAKAAHRVQVRTIQALTWALGPPVRFVLRLVKFPAQWIKQHQAPIRVKILDNWGDADEALALLLPGRKGQWDRVHFSTRGWLFRRPDYVLVLNQPSKPTRLRMSPNRVWFAIGEPPTQSHEALHLGQASGTTVFTPAHYPSMNANGATRHYRPAHAMTRTWWVKRTFEELNRTTEVPKSRMLSCISSNLTLLAGHRARLAFVERARQELPIDLFGRGFREIGDKWSGLAPYRFSLAYENTRAPGYFTEKLMDCLVCLTVPLYVGATDIHDYFPADSVIVIDPDDPDVFEKIRSLLTVCEYERRLPALRAAKHLVLNRYNMFVHLADAIMNDRDPAERPREIELKPVTLDWSLSQ
ncbi:MAG: glycosyltransferase [Bryobacterales bacterium]|nr:glycosyltransferase [Bryobacterales bacterium]